MRFADVQKSYDGETLVVKSLNLDIERGEFLTMLGPSGSGKTTCLMMLAGFETATYGEIFLDGRPINNVAPHRRDIGMVFQNYALFPHMTVHENLAFRRVADPLLRQRLHGRRHGDDYLRLRDVRRPPERRLSVWRAAARSLIPSRHARRTLRYSSAV